MRDMMAVAEEGRAAISLPYEMTCAEMTALYMLINKGNDGVWEALTTAFYYGFALALRAENNAKRRARKEAREAWAKERCSA